MNSLQQLLDFLERLDDDGIEYQLRRGREAIMVMIVTPLAYYEIEFFANGEIVVQPFAAGPVKTVSLEKITARVLAEMS